MTTIAVFGKQGCAKCKTTKNKLHHYVSRWNVDHQVQVTFHDLETLDGRAEGAFYDVNQIPLTVVELEGRPVARWDGVVPNSDALRKVIEEGAHVSAD
jgi:glutaredoxin